MYGSQTGKLLNGNKDKNKIQIPSNYPTIQINKVWSLADRHMYEYSNENDNQLSANWCWWDRAVKIFVM